VRRGIGHITVEKVAVIEKRIQRISHNDQDIKKKEKMIKEDIRGENISLILLHRRAEKVNFH
jgi:hypothetical protein